MPAQPLVDLATLDFEHPLATIEGIRQVNPHRFEFEMLTGMLFAVQETGMVGAWKDLTPDEWWVRGHIPGRPIFPGALMIEAAAQMCSYWVTQALGGNRFVGFGGVDGVKFRGQVTPPARLILVGKMVEFRPRRAVCDAQGFVDGKMVFEGRITGMPI